MPKFALQVENREGRPTYVARTDKVNFRLGWQSFTHNLGFTSIIAHPKILSEALPV
jgi:hypothetical protein